LGDKSIAFTSHDETVAPVNALLSQMYFTEIPGAILALGLQRGIRYNNLSAMMMH